MMTMQRLCDMTLAALQEFYAKYERACPEPRGKKVNDYMKQIKDQIDKKKTEIVKGTQ